MRDTSLQKAYLWELFVDPFIPVLQHFKPFYLSLSENIYINCLAWLSDKWKKITLMYINNIEIYIENNTWVHRDIWNLFLSVQLNISRVLCSHSWDIELNTRTEIPNLQTTLHSFLFNHINSLLTRRNCLNSCSQKRTCCHSFFMVLN